MIQNLENASRGALVGFDTIIDVRSPAEFAEDHVPNALNLPVLNDDERAVVGTVYVQRSRFEARRLGAAMVARNIASHLEGALHGCPPGFAPLVYCWRGGQRSAAMATVLDQVGWRPTLLVGGYRTYRHEVRARLDKAAANIVLLSGHTGTAKTAMLSEIRSLGLQVVDLEALARHRGSLLGALANAPQPSQKMFESRLAIELADLDPSKPVLMEAESSKIGEINIPEALWRAMKSAPVIEVRAPLLARARYLVSTYRDLTADPARLIALLDRLPGPHGRATIESWRGLVHDRLYEALAAGLMEAHYDPAYTRWSRKHPRPCLDVIDLQELSRSSIMEAAKRIAARLKDLDIR